MRLIEHFFRIFAPDECINCGVECALVCQQCSLPTMPKPPSRCYRCYRLTLNNATCKSCRSTSPLRNVWIRTLYNPTSKKVVHNLKFSFNRDTAKLIAREIASSLPNLHTDTLIVHIPAATSHVRHRGFDQSALIARELSILVKRPHLHCLVRLGQLRQVGAARTTRLQQMKGVFRVVSPYVVHGSHILLIDDVTTTGSTLEAAAHALRLEGAKSVMAACFAQAH